MLRSLSVAGAIAIVVGLTASSGSAAPGAPAAPAPTTSAQALAQLRAFNQEFEKVTEQYNNARILLKKRAAESKAAAAKARKAAAAVASYRDRVRKLVKSESRTDPFGTFGAMLTSGSAGDFAAQVSIIDVVATRRASVLSAASTASAAAKAASATAVAATAAAAKLTHDLQSKRADLQKRAARSKALFAKLSASERQAFFTSSPTGTTRASRTETRSPTVDPPPANVPVSGRAAAAVATARAQLGKPYVWAAAGPGSFDCSGLTMYSWAAAGVSLPHSSSLQIGVGTRVARSELKPGDLVFFGSPIHHVGMYVGGGMMIHAPQTGDVVKYTSIDVMGDYAGATRPG